MATREVADGTTFTQFDGQGRPTAGDKDHHRFGISYDGSGNATWTFDDGNRVVYDPSGKPIREVVDGTTFDRFDGQGRPTDGVDKVHHRFGISYDGSGNATWTFDNHDQVVYDLHGNPIRAVVDGTTFDKPDGQGRWTDGVDQDHRHFTIGYDDKAGTETWTFDNHDQVVYDLHGNPIREVVDGTTFDKFDDQGRPTHGFDKKGQPFTITYDANGDIFAHYGDGTTTETDPNGHLIKTWLPDGTEIDFAVDVPALHDAIGKVRTERDYISDRLHDLKRIFTDVTELWDSPAEKSFPPVVDAFSTSADTFVAVLDDAISRMRRAYENYTRTENTNTNNLMGVSGGLSGADRPDSHYTARLAGEHHPARLAN